MRREVDIATEDGTVLRAFLHIPDGAGPAPLIVMAHGFSGVKDRIDHYAKAFADDGFCVLLHDHRGFGTSGGTRRLEIDPAVQIADWRDVITFGLDLAEVDAGSGVGIWGSSFAGGLAMVIAATDTRVACVVSQIPNVSGPRNTPRMVHAAMRERFRVAFEEDRRGRLAGGAPAMIPVFTTQDGGLCAMRPAVSPKYLAAIEAQTSTWSNQVTLRSLENAFTFEPAGWAPFISPTPFLMIVGREDICTFPEIQIEVFAQAREPKRLVIHPGGHFDTYTEHFEQTCGAARAWFREHLNAKPAPARAMPARAEPHMEERA